ncbi:MULTISPECIES: hypothetical protein [Dehalococcoides]|uniref:hypothetical protein n=1 Tax=Dehalococcoides TaxID=61434 RepID=UPI0005B57706|nr:MULTISPECIES: hypothetical protein [Dehalococcoides]QYY58594.1 hypothetical protein CWV2_000525 [Dehalococcoides mccartyi]BAQ34021.1 hypothetical protein UCH007_00630 [Dehalococcoides sp. UCH007]
MSYLEEQEKIGIHPSQLGNKNVSSQMLEYSSTNRNCPVALARTLQLCHMTSEVLGISCFHQIADQCERYAHTADTLVRDQAATVAKYEAVALEEKRKQGFFQFGIGKV